MTAKLLGAGALALLLAALPARADVDVGISIGGAIHGDGYSLYFGGPYYGVPFGYLTTRPHYTRHYYRYDYPRPYYRYDYPRRYYRDHHRHYKHYGHPPYRYDRGRDHHRGNWHRDGYGKSDRQRLRDDHGGRHHDFFRGDRHHR